MTTHTNLITPGKSLLIKISILLLCLFSMKPVLLSQVSPFSISPDWAFGDGGRAVFPSGSYPTSGAPAFSSRGTNIIPSPEASTSICFSNGAIALYSNTSYVYNGNSSTGWSDYIRSLNNPAMTGNPGDNTCASSSTGGAVAFPDPASPSNAFYMVLSNDQTGGNCENRGINLYRFTGTGNNVVYNAGPTNMLSSAFPGEAITAGTDGAGGYWLVVHDKSTTHTYKVWHFTAGGITGPVDYSPGGGNVDNTTGTQSYLKISPCQNKIAYNSGGTIVVNNFNRTTGAVGAEIRRVAHSGTGVGLEFSPDGNRVFYNNLGAGLGGTVNYVDLVSGTTGIVAGSVSWSLQMGPDGKIYTSPTGTSIGVISTPNGTPTYSTTSLAAGSSIHRGLANMVWLTPNTPAINKTVTACTVDFTHTFQNYFLSNVGVNTGSFSWNFGDGNTATGTSIPTHTYSVDGTYNVSVSFTDATCGYTWSASTTVTTACPMPVDWLDISAAYHNGVVLVDWATAMEYDNDYFEVQRSSDGVNYYTIGTVDSYGNSQMIQNYSFTDHSPLSGNSYYRIIQHDYDGQQTTSPHAQVHIEQSVVSVVPNPSTSAFTLSISGSETATVVVTDVLGRVIYQNHLSGEVIQISFGEDLTPGTYALQVLTVDGSHTEKIVKQ